MVVKLPQNVVYLSAARKAVAYAEPQAGVVLCSQCGGNVFQAVVSCVAAFSFEPQGAKGQCQVVHHH